MWTPLHSIAELKAEVQSHSWVCSQPCALLTGQIQTYIYSRQWWKKSSYSSVSPLLLYLTKVYQYPKLTKRVLSKNLEKGFRFPNLFFFLFLLYFDIVSLMKSTQSHIGEENWEIPQIKRWANIFPHQLTSMLNSNSNDKSAVLRWVLNHGLWMVHNELKCSLLGLQN